jgi:hypothetical protein
VPHVDFSYQQEKYQAGLMCVSFNGTSHDFEAHKLLDALVARYNPTCPYQLAMGGSEVDWQLFESETEWPFQGIHVFHEITAFSEWI